ncbi:MAG TPA: hypothetical protein VGC21_17665 [Telluria sp.]
MSSSALVLQNSLQLGPVLRLLASTAVTGATLLFFRPLLTGIFRAALLTLRPRLSREERIARAKLRDMRLMQKMIAASSGPSHAAELRAISARD